MFNNKNIFLCIKYNFIKSISPWLIFSLVNIIFWLASLVWFLFATLLIGSLFSNSFAPDLEISGTPILTNLPKTSMSLALESNILNIHMAEIQPHRWSLHLGPFNGSFGFLFMLISILEGAYILWILFVLRSVVLSIKECKSFHFSNVKRFQKMGFLFLLIEPYHWISEFFWRSFFQNYPGLRFQDFLSATSIKFSMGGSSSITWILIGGICLLLAEVFRQGLEMKKEQELTI